VSLSTLTMRRVMLPEWLTRSQQLGTWECQMGGMGLIREYILQGESGLMGECAQGGAAQSAATRQQPSRSTHNQNPNNMYAAGTYLQRGSHAG
jgi:hypothetical protein